MRQAGQVFFHAVPFASGCLEMSFGARGQLELMGLWDGSNACCGRSRITFSNGSWPDAFLSGIRTQRDVVDVRQTICAGSNVKSPQQMGHHGIDATLSKGLANTHSAAPAKGAVGACERLELAAGVHLVLGVKLLGFRDSLAESVHFPELLSQERDKEDVSNIHERPNHANCQTRIAPKRTSLGDQVVFALNVDSQILGSGVLETQRKGWAPSHDLCEQARGQSTER